MRTLHGNLHLEIQTSRKSPAGLLRTSFRDPATGKIRHSQHGRITGCTLDQLRLLQRAFRQEAPYLARMLPQLPRLVHQALARDPAPDLRPQVERLIAVQRQQNVWLAVISMLLAALLGLLLVH